ncbi:arginase family protein [Microbacterium sp. NPDC055903]
MARFLVVPQWQGSPAPRAMLLTDGAAAIAGDLPSAATTVLDVPLEAGESLESGVQRLSALQRVRELMRDHIDEGVVVIGGDCSITVAALAALPRGTDDLAVVWCDAHPDLHLPGTSPSGAFSGMSLRAVMGEGESRLILSPGVPSERVVLVGARSVDAAEEAPLETVAAVEPEALIDADSIARAVEATGAARAWVHIDVDVLDPSELAGVSDPAPFGAAAAQLSAALRALRQRVPLAGATIAGFAPRTPAAAVDDLGAILRLIGAVA